ncbi:MAG: hypothetical protein U5Q44_01450 [Dehalococcoidia bacterium]|nr:hypothetical protein [Dehalococcoidia bacterium]
MERLGEIVVTADFEARDDVAIAVQGRQEDDGDAGRDLPELRAGVESAAIGQHHIEHGKLRGFLPAEADSRPDFLEMDNLMAITFERVGDDVGVVLIVFYKECERLRCTLPVRQLGLRNAIGGVG